MKLKPLEPGDSVKVKCRTSINGNGCTVYLDGKIVKEAEDPGYWIVEYQLDPYFGAPKYQDSWNELDITSKHYSHPSDKELFEKAEKIDASDYEGAIFHNDQYYDSLEEFLDYCEYFPDYVWACTTNPIKLNLDLGSIVGEALEDDGYVGLSTHSKFDGLYYKLAELQKQFEQVASEFQVYYPNYKKVVIINE